jgi:Fur family ferric uptake transcriptional regulator
VNVTPRTADDVLAVVRARGGRVTASRRAVIEALLSGEHHVTADEIATRVAAEHPDVHRSTVYRTLERLQEVGVVTHVHLGHGPSTFHLADPPHTHAVCTVCGTVVEVPGDALDGLAERLRSDLGFELASQHFALSGRCAACVAASASAPPPARSSSG